VKTGVRVNSSYRPGLEQTAERFRREQPLLGSTERYYRLNVERGLEEEKEVKEAAAATRNYISSQKVLQQMQACTGSIADQEY
jgi:hypothetical protein